MEPELKPRTMDSEVGYAASDEWVNRQSEVPSSYSW